MASLRNARGYIQAMAAWPKRVGRGIAARLRVLDERARMATIVRSAQDAIYSLDTSGLVRTWNRGAERLFGWTAAEIIGRPIELTMPADQADGAGEAIEVRAAGGEMERRFEAVRQRRDGALVEVSLAVSPIRAADGALVARSVIARDITGRKRAERRLRRTTRALSTLSQANAALVGAVSEETLYQRMCDIIVRTGGYRMAWIGRPREDAGQTIEPVAFAGHEDGYLSAITLTWADVEHGRGPTGRAVRERRAQTNRAYQTDPAMAPWREPAQARGYRSSLALPLLDESGVFGLLTIYAAEADAFDPDEVRLYEDLAGNLAFGVISLRHRLARDRLAAIVESSRDAIISVRLDGAVLSWNAGAADMLGYAAEEIIGRDSAILVPPERRGEIAGALARIARGESIRILETERVRRDGGRVAVALMVSPTRDLTGRVTGASTILRDITDRKRFEHDLMRAARFDSLTGLPNRASLVEGLARSVIEARRNRRNHALLFMDLDHFKDINDTLGHPVGDQLLQQVAERLGETVREADVVARFGGDEFAIVCRDIGEPTAAAALAQRVISALDQPFRIDGAEIRSGASVGIAVFGPEAPSAQTLLSWADIALYRAKSEGRGVFRFFTEAMDHEVRRRVSLAGELRAAVDGDQLMLLYQPQVDGRTGRLVGLESLVRWNHPSRGLVGPAEFMPIAEQTGLAVPLGHWVTRKACAQIRAWLDAGLTPPTVAINVSGLHFRAPGDLEIDLLITLAEFKLSPGQIELELTETVLMESSATHSETLRRLRERGFRLAIDDFGTGYSSLDYLRRFPVDRIKIDRNFVRDLDASPGDAAIVRATIGLAQALGLRVMAEGVETDRQRQALLAWDCEEMQGFHFAPPLPAETVSELLRSGAFLPPTSGR